MNFDRTISVFTDMLRVYNLVAPNADFVDITLHPIVATDMAHRLQLVLRYLDIQDFLYQLQNRVDALTALGAVPVLNRLQYSLDDASICLSWRIVYAPNKEHTMHIPLNKTYDELDARTADAMAILVNSYSKIP